MLEIMIGWECSQEKNKNSRRIVVGNSYETASWTCMKMEQDETGVSRENGGQENRSGRQEASGND